MKKIYSTKNLFASKIKFNIKRNFSPQSFTSFSNQKTLRKNNSSKSSQDIQNKHKEEIERIKFSNTLTVNELKLKYENEISGLKIENLKIKENLDKAKEMENVIHKLKLQLQQKNTQELELTEKEEKFKKMPMEYV